MEAPLSAASLRTSRLSLGRFRLAPVCRRNSGPSVWPVAEMRASSAVTAHSEGSPDGAMRMVAPMRNGSVLEHLIRTWYPSADLVRSPCVSDTSSLLLMKPKTASSSAAQRVRWSWCEITSKGRNERSKKGVMGNLRSAGHPCTRLIPFIRRRRLRASAVGSGSPCSRCMLRTAEVYRTRHTGAVPGRPVAVKMAVQAACVSV